MKASTKIFMGLGGLLAVLVIITGLMSFIAVPEESSSNTPAAPSGQMF